MSAVCKAAYLFPKIQLFIEWLFKYKTKIINMTLKFQHTKWQSYDLVRYYMLCFFHNEEYPKNTEIFLMKT